jgi:UDP-GlcNAc:undecaprenyl-phosphate/decaprenyl-phosphate GlcNAc-1-phosphate transferase
MDSDWPISLLAIAVILVSAELIYFRLAKRFRIIDKPNERSSHVRPVIRGGGIIFCVAVLVWFAYSGFVWPWVTLAITAAAFISFLDDINPQPARIRFTIHFIAVLLVFYSIGLFEWPVWLWMAALVISIGALNAFNFMDGINGITGIYSLVMLGTFAYVNSNLGTFTYQHFIGINLVAVLVFLFFNFRRKAACFAGDVGSVTMAFILIFLLLQLIHSSMNLLWVLLFVVYGIDAVVTILYRVARRENIFKAHRAHLYQYLCNEFKWPHRAVSLLYGMVQLVMNVVIVFSVREDRPTAAITAALAILGIYMAARLYVTRKISVPSSS